jgi:hypothetical protein
VSPTPQHRREVLYLASNASKGQIIGGFRRTDHYLDGRSVRQEIEPNGLSQPALDAIAFYSGPAKTRNYQTNAHDRHRRTSRPHEKIRRSDRLPFALYAPNLFAAAKPMRASKVEASFTRRRTWTGVLR